MFLARRVLPVYKALLGWTRAFPRGRGGIGRRAGLKIRFRKECRFDPDRPHHLDSLRIDRSVATQTRQHHRQCDNARGPGGSGSEVPGPDAGSPIRRSVEVLQASNKPQGFPPGG
jgi:hypothetical protein